LNVSFDGNIATFLIPIREKETHIIAFFAPIHDRARVGLVTFTPTHV
jgi:hypothetical protein